MKKILLLPLFSIPVLLLLNRCATDDVCTHPTESLVNLKFFTINNSIETSIKVDSLTVLGSPPPDSNYILYYKANNLAALTLPMDPTQDFCSFDLIFQLSDTLVQGDTSIVSLNYSEEKITLHYTRNLQLVSPECGFGYSYFVDSIFHTSNVIKYIEIVDPVLTPENYGNFKIFI